MSAGTAYGPKLSLLNLLAQVPSWISDIPIQAGPNGRRKQLHSACTNVINNYPECNEHLAWACLWLQPCAEQDDAAYLRQADTFFSPLPVTASPELTRETFAGIGDDIPKEEEHVKAFLDGSWWNLVPDVMSPDSDVDPIADWYKNRLFAQESPWKEARCFHIQHPNISSYRDRQALASLGVALMWTGADKPPADLMIALHALIINAAGLSALHEIPDRRGLIEVQKEALKLAATIQSARGSVQKLFTLTGDLTSGNLGRYAAPRDYIPATTEMLYLDTGFRHDWEVSFLKKHFPCFVKQVACILVSYAGGQLPPIACTWPAGTEEPIAKLKDISAAGGFRAFDALHPHFRDLIDSWIPNGNCEANEGQCQHLFEILKEMFHYPFKKERDRHFTAGLLALWAAEVRVPSEDLKPFSLFKESTRLGFRGDLKPDVLRGLNQLRDELRPTKMRLIWDEVSDYARTGATIIYAGCTEESVRSLGVQTDAWTVNSKGDSEGGFVATIGFLKSNRATILPDPAERLVKVKL